MTRLEKLRKRLGQCDEILLDAILMRHHIIKDIMAYKEENGLNILDPEQEERQKEWLDGRLEDESNASEVWDIFHAIGKAGKQMQARKLFDYNIVLIGFMGAGKTSISEYLKTLFAMDVIEMDQIIAEREGMSIPDIFEVHGEQYFRDLETNLLIEMQARKLFDYNIVLIGFMGAGKTSISEYLKTLFAMDIIEMDQIIAEREGMSIPDIFEVHGEQYFRDLETNLLIEMQSRKNVVISCGGGTPLRECNVVEMKKNGRVVLLTASPETIFDRVKDSHDRPVIENNKNVPFIADLMEKRRAKYEAAADIVINTDGKSIIEVCEELVQKLLAMDENDK